MKILEKIKGSILNKSGKYSFYKDYYEETKKDSRNLKILENQINELKEKTELYKKSNFFEPGHFYSPIPNVELIKNNEKKVFSRNNVLYGIDLNENTQFKYLNSIKSYYKELPFEEEAKEGLRYKYNNSSYGFSDAIFLFGMIRTLKPKKIIEVGCGFSSCVTLDTNELFFNNNIETTFIEPYPKLFYSLIKEEDVENTELIQSKLQDVDLSMFKDLKENDILFIDSTHVSKFDSDVNYLIHTILPNLNKGVYIHFHDIFYPFEYHKPWILEGRAWNEMYVLRAFLQFNDSFEIILFNTFLEEKYEDIFLKDMPLCLKNRGGSLWIKKVK